VNFLTISETTSFLTRTEANGDYWMVDQVILWQPSYERYLQYSRAIPRKHSNFRSQTLSLWRQVHR